MTTAPIRENIPIALLIFNEEMKKGDNRATEKLEPIAKSVKRLVFEL